MGRLILVFLGFLVLGLALFEPASGTPFGAWIRGERISDPPGELASLRQENAALKSELASLKSVKDELSSSATALRGMIAAVVYARYPFNFKHELLVGAGMDSGVAKGDAVFFSAKGGSLPDRQAGASGGGGNDFALVGRVSEVFAREATVMTVYDPRYEEAVRIGSRGTEALLTGGSSPKITLIPKNSPVAEGDAVYTASTGEPFGAAVGEVKNVHRAEDELWSEAELIMPYDIAEAHAVRIFTANR